MPYRKKRPTLRRRFVRRPIRRRRYVRRTRYTRRRTRTGRKTASVQVSKGIGSFFRDKLRTKLVYTSFIEFVATIGSGQLYFANVWRGNGPQQVDQTSSTGQPYGWDQCASLYNKYKVYGSKISVVPVAIDSSTSNGQVGSFQLVCFPHTTTTNVVSGGTVINDLERVDGARYIWVNNYFSPRRDKISNYCSTAKALSTNRNFVNASDDQVASLTTSLPATPWYWHLYGRNAQLDNLSSITVQVQITYYLEFSQNPMYPSS